jgi:YVTN family beta-propeller protein
VLGHAANEDSRSPGGHVRPVRPNDLGCLRLAWERFTLVRAMADMPSGAVTFLFTDIEGSTRLVKQLRDRYVAVLADHQRLLRAAFVAHGGYEVDTQGDSFFVAFSSAREALLASVEGQLALRSHSWPDGVDIRVRMGLHTGQAVASGGRYTGLAVHRAARIGAAGHGGQILVSQATQTLLEDEEEDLHVFLRDLGEQRLKDLDRPVRLYQAGAEGLPASFPPVRGDAELAQAAEAALRPPLWRRPAVLLAAIAVLLIVVSGAVFLAGRDSAGGLAGVGANAVGIIDPSSNAIVAEVPVGIRPGPIAVGEGSVWVGNLQDRTLTRIDPVQRTVAGTIALESRTPTGIAVGLGAVWVAHGLRGEVSLVDAQFGQLTRSVKVGGTAFGSPHGSVALDAGSAWVAFGDSTLARLGPGGEILASGFAGNLPAGLLVAAGSVWVSNSGDATVQRFNPETFREGPLRIFNVGARPTGMVYADRAIWVAIAGDGVATRIDPSSGATRHVSVGAGASALAVGAGSVWVANTAAGTVSRIDSETNDVVATIETGNAPSGLAFADGHLWVTVQAP